MQLEVLLVEDSADDVELARVACAEISAGVNLHTVGNGRECLAYLRHEGLYATAPSPDIILLDLNMPVMNGYEVLRELEADPALRHHVVIVLTTSSAEQDVLRSSQLKCNAYLVKPTRYAEFVEVLRATFHYWTGVARLPHASAAESDRLRKALQERTKPTPKKKAPERD